MFEITHRNCKWPTSTSGCRTTTVPFGVRICADGIGLAAAIWLDREVAMADPVRLAEPSAIAIADAANSAVANSAVE